VAIVYVILGLVIAVIGGTMIEKLHMEKHVESFVLSAGSVDIESPDLTIRERLTYAKEQMLGTFKKVFPYILVGVGIGALIHNWIPESWIETVLGSNNPFGAILATIVGIPMYADIFGTIPVAEALLSKGAQLGTVLSFMMAVTTLSLPSLIMLRKAVKPKLLALFIGICTIGIIIVGYLPCKHREDWGLDDPTGKSDKAFLEIIQSIKEKIDNLRNRIEHNALL